MARSSYTPQNGGLLAFSTSTGRSLEYSPVDSSMARSITHIIAGGGFPGLTSHPSLSILSSHLSLMTVSNRDDLAECQREAQLVLNDPSKADFSCPW